jgi:hypothetical protein
MKAVVMTEFKRPLELQELTDPKPGPNDALIRTEACGICRSDWHLWQGLDLGRRQRQAAIGHGTRIHGACASWSLSARGEGTCGPHARCRPLAHAAHALGHE